MFSSNSFSFHSLTPPVLLLETDIDMMPRSAGLAVLVIFLTIAVTGLPQSLPIDPITWSATEVDEWAHEVVTSVKKVCNLGQGQQEPAISVALYNLYDSLQCGSNCPTEPRGLQMSGAIAWQLTSPAEFVVSLLMYAAAAHRTRSGGAELMSFGQSRWKKVADAVTAPLGFSAGRDGFGVLVVALGAVKVIE